MRKGLWLAAVLVVLIALVMGCQVQPQPTAPSLAIMIESNIAEVGSSFMVSGSNLNPQQKIWVEWDYRTSHGKAGCTGCCCCCCGEPDEDGTIHTVIHVPEDVVPGDYEVEVYQGAYLCARELIALLPIHIQAGKKSGGNLGIVIIRD